MNRIATRLRTLTALGPWNVLRVAAYRIRLRFGGHPVQHVKPPLPVAGHFFKYKAEPFYNCTPSPVWRDEGLLFGAHRIPVSDAPPKWRQDPLDGANAHCPPPLPLVSWWKIEDFARGDIKRVWELSRFDWVLALAQRSRAGDAGAALRMERWLADWSDENPAYCGPNWKCAQEASIRVLHLAIAAMILGEEHALTGAMRALIDTHLQRIIPTLSYARAQDNNHATTEAAALFVVGAWYHIAGISGAYTLLRKGRALFERSVSRLFESDGSFSQYSLNYHRLALDTVSLAEIWRKRAGLEPFSPLIRQRAASASRWLHAMVDPRSGDAPNLGANDGANLLPLTEAGYRDYRPTVQLAYALFCSDRAYPAGPWDDGPAWLGVELPETVHPLSDRAVFDDGGYAVLRKGGATAVMRYPRFRFRPSQADALHVDLWHDGVNLLRDGGSYSYNTEAEWIEYFGGVESHNTVQFDGAPQMPRLSRFLLGDWLVTQSSGLTTDGFFAAYHHRAGWRHRRHMVLAGELRVTDMVAGFEREARLRWRLAPGNWRIDGDTVTNGRHCLSLNADVPLSINLVQGWESRHYLEKTPLPVIEAVVTEPGQITSIYRWAQ